MTFGQKYRELSRTLPLGLCPLESGALGSLADNECEHGRLPTDVTQPCGCWPEEGLVSVPRLRVVEPVPERVVVALPASGEQLAMAVGE